MHILKDKYRGYKWVPLLLNLLIKYNFYDKMQFMYNCSILIINIHIPFYHKNYISLANSIIMVPICSHDIHLSKYARIVNFPYFVPKIWHHFDALLLLLLLLLFLLLLLLLLLLLFAIVVANIYLLKQTCVCVGVTGVYIRRQFAKKKTRVNCTLPKIQ